MLDQWYFEIGDGQEYGPYPLEKLQKWAAAGDLMPTHRVRHAESDEWVIAAYVKGLEGTIAAPAEEHEDPQLKKKGRGVFGLGKPKPAAPAEHKPAVEPSAKPLPANATEACDEILRAAHKAGASDIHIDPEENIVLVQLRVDGTLEAFRKYPKSMHPAVIGRFKVLANMDIAEKREAQDGRFTYEFGEREKQRVDIRAACLPTTKGERLTLRLLATEAGRLTLGRLGFSEDGRKLFTNALGLRQGMILLTGPTGAGKSTTLYAALRHRLANKPGRIITVEEPVEFDIVGVSQVEVDTADKVAFGTVLRNILRSDPDVIMIGEMRDFESASTGVKAALTGHLVLSSLHTNSAAGAATRLIDLGIEPFLVAATIQLSVAQRLVRRLCLRCRKPRELKKEEALAIGRPGVEGITVYDPGGCPECHRRGFAGRVGVFEMMCVDDKLREMINDHASEADLKAAMPTGKGMLLVEDAADKLLKGLTSFEEVMTLGPFV
ncbi:MAG: Flp pilus assembly complex ATPase component TadA [Planctomycetales bacterium]|nr:Flp pilus assembly complex ATPase component TadA [Planctomycetales bacterium]